MNSKRVFYKIVLTVMLLITLISCLCLLCGCHVFPWYAPKKYSNKKMQEIYSYINNDLLTNLSSYIATICYTESGENENKFVSVNIFVSNGKFIISGDTYTEFSEVSRFVYYDGLLKEYDSVAQSENLSQVEEIKFECLFDNVRRYSAYLQTVVGTEYDDGYCWECFPWGIGMAQIYYTVDCEKLGVQEAHLTASWTVQKSTLFEKKPLVSDATFSFGSDIGGIYLELYAEPYEIAARIDNILQNYEDHKNINTEE